MFVKDLGSSNGTYLNGLLLTPNVAYRLNEGDLLQFGVDDVYPTTALRKEQLVILQVKFPLSKPVPTVFTEPNKKTFSPGRILQEARSMLSRSGKIGAPSMSISLNDVHRRSMYGAWDENSVLVQDLTSRLIALAQRHVEQA